MILTLLGKGIMKQGYTVAEVRRIFAYKFHFKTRTMKFAILSFLTLVSLSAFSQSINEGPFKSYKLDGGQITFDQVYNCDSMSVEQIESMLTRSIPIIKGVKDFRKEDKVITCRFDKALIDYRKYGAKWGTTPVVLNHPFEANVTVQWKDNKYRVILTNIVFNTAGFGAMEMDMMLTRKKKTVWDTRPGALQIGNLTEQYFSDLFTISPNDNW